MTSRMASLRSNGYFGVNDFLSRVRIRAMTSPARVPSRMMRWMAPFFFSSRRRHTIWTGDWSSDVCSSDLIAEIVEQSALLLIRLHGGLDLVDRPAGDFGGLVAAALRHGLGERRHARRRARSLHVVVVVGRENGGVDIAIAIGPERIDVVIVGGPQRVIEEVAIRIGPEHGPDPAQMMEGMPAMAPERAQRPILGEVPMRRKSARVGMERGALRGRQSTRGRERMRGRQGVR